MGKKIKIPNIPSILFAIEKQIGTKLIRHYAIKMVFH